MNRFALLAGSAAAVIAMAQAPAARAQDGTPATPQPQSETHASVDEIVVTATRRATNLQSTPVAVSAIGENVIAQTAARNIGDLAAFVPNFSAAKIAGFNAASFSIRGASQTNISMYSEPPITVLVDDFVIAHVQTQLLDTFDLAGMEVLRGPQGTLFGKNTTGGAIVVRTKRPELDILSVQGMVRAGSFGTRQIKGAVNVPLVEDMLALRVVGSYEKSDGYMRRGGCYGPITPLVANSKWAGAAGCGDGKRVGGDDIFDGRVKLLWKPGDRTDVLFQYQALRDRSDAATGVNGTPANNPRFLLSRLNIVEGTGDPLDNAGGSFRSGFLLDQDDGTSVDVDMYQIHVDQEVDFGQFSANVGRRDELAHLPQSYVFSNVPTIDGETLSLYDGDRAFKRRTQQAELRFASDFGGPFDFVAGVFHQRDKVYRCGHQLLGFLDLSSRPGPFGPNNLNPQLLCNAQKARSTAGYIEGNYKLTEKLTLTAGIRYTTETKRWWGRPTVYVQQLVSPADPNFTWQDLGRALDGNVFAYPTGVVSSKTTWKEPTWRGTASYQASDDIFAYLTYSRGFKSGLYADSTGISGAAIVPSQLVPTSPEKADSFELGVKTELLDKRLRFNLALFHVTYNDAQRQVNVPVIRLDGSQIQETRYFNAAKAVVKGVEAEITAVPLDGVTLRSAIGYQDAKYKSFVSPLPTGRDLAEAPLERTPRWQAALDGTYETAIGDWGKITFNGNVQYAGRNLYNLSLTSALDDAYLPSRTLFNASITWSDPDDRYYLRVIGQNLGDKRYLVGHLVAGGLFATKNYGPPRFLAAEFGFKM